MIPHYQNFQDDYNVLHLELGGGCGNFGKLYHSPCYITEKDEEGIAQCSQNYIDFWCDAENMMIPEDRFEEIIMCNPYGFGFKNNEPAQTLLKNIATILKNNGKCIIIANSTNGYARYEKISKEVTTFNQSNQVTFIVESEDIDASQLYQSYEFYTTAKANPTIPNKKITLYVTK